MTSWLRCSMSGLSMIRDYATWDSLTASGFCKVGARSPALIPCQSKSPIIIRAIRISSSSPAIANPARAANLALAWRLAWKAYPVQNGGLAISTLGPSRVRGCPQQNKSVRPIPSGGSTRGMARAAQPERGPQRDTSPGNAPPTNSARMSRFSAVTRCPLSSFTPSESHRPSG